MNTKIKWNEFQTLCHEAWRTEGQGSNDVKTVHNYLVNCEKKVTMFLNEVISSAWKLYKEDVNISAL